MSTRIFLQSLHSEDVRDSALGATQGAKLPRLSPGEEIVYDLRAALAQFEEIQSEMTTR